MLKDRLNIFLNQCNDKRQRYDAKTGDIAALLQKLAIQEDECAKKETPPEHYTEIVTQLRNNSIQDTQIRIINGVMARYMRELVQEQDASQLLERLLQFASDRQSTRLHKNILRGCLSCLDIDSTEVSKLVLYAQSFTPEYPLRWRQRLEHFKLLEQPYGGFIGSLLARSNNEDSYNQLISNSGLQSFRNTGIGRCAYLRLCDSIYKISSGSESPEQIEQAINNWKYHAIGPTPDSEKFTPLMAANDIHYGVEKMLLPWASKQPVPLVKNTIQNLLLNTLNDPRTKPANWSGVDEQCILLMKQWLALESFEAFIRVISKVARVKQWQDRKEFWGWYLDENHVTEIWPIVGTKAALELSRMNRQATDGRTLKFGRLGGAQSDQSVLLMKIGDLTIAEWSHMGSVRFWAADNPSAPKLYQSDYQGRKLRQNSNWDRPHQRSWQSDVDRKVAQYTGIRNYNHKASG